MQSVTVEAHNQSEGISMVGSTRDDIGRLVLSCPDRPAILAALINRITAVGANIVRFDQFSTAPEGGRLYLRAEFLLNDLADHLPDLRSEQPSEHWFTLVDKVV